MRLNHIRNFSIIAHIDHGKSTLSDRIIQMCGGLSEREMDAQVLDSMDIERERGITIKAQSVSLDYTARNGEVYRLNFIDTPGHVDFSYEVSRSLAACEGALLVVDASQGVEAQSVANCYTAIDLGLTVVPILNKIDLPSAEPERVKQEIEDVIGIDAHDAVLTSAKTGIGVDDVLERLIAEIPPPTGNEEALKALIIDSWFDNYVGVIALVRVIDGAILPKRKIKAMGTGDIFQVEKVGVFTPKTLERDGLYAGDVGFVIAGIKNIDSAKVGDTLTDAENGATEALPGFKEMQPRVFSGLYPVEGEDYEDLREALRKLRLNDAALHFEPEVSQALGFGFRCGFLGLLHMEIVQERLEREYDLDLITTAPTVVYEVLETAGDAAYRIHNPAQLPNPSNIKELREPIIEASIFCPDEYVGAVIGLCIEKRGVQKNLSYAGQQVTLVFELPLGEVVLDFFDRLKSISRGYASFDYKFVRFEPSDLVKMDMLINGEIVDALSLIVHRSISQSRGRDLAEKLKELIPQQMFEVAVQAAIGAKIIARTTVKALRKNVLAKCYGGDVSRKRKLLDKQKKGKKRMKQIGQVEVPQEAFLAVLKMDNK